MSGFLQKLISLETQTPEQVAVHPFSTLPSPRFQDPLQEGFEEIIDGIAVPTRRDSSKNAMPQTQRQAEEPAPSQSIGAPSKEVLNRHKRGSSTANTKFTPLTTNFDGLHTATPPNRSPRQPSSKELFHPGKSSETIPRKPPPLHVATATQSRQSGHQDSHSAQHPTKFNALEPRGGQAFEAKSGLPEKGTQINPTLAPYPLEHKYHKELEPAGTDKHPQSKKSTGQSDNKHSLENRSFYPARSRPVFSASRELRAVATQGKSHAQVHETKPPIVEIQIARLVVRSPQRKNFPSAKPLESPSPDMSLEQFMLKRGGER